MNRRRLPLPTAAARTLLAGSALAVGLAAQTTVSTALVPAFAPTANANSSFALPGFAEPQHLQIVVDPQHLVAVQGQTIQGLRFRRQPFSRALAGGGAFWVVRLSIAAAPAAQTQPVFAANEGPAPVTAPAQLVVAPANPSGTTPIPWGPSDSIVVPLPPFAYAGGPLCIDIVGRPDPNQPAAEWPVDALLSPRSSAVSTAGPGCGAYGGGNWSFVEPETLLVGQTTHFTAFGAPGGFGMALFHDTAAPFAFDLRLLGAAPGCFLHLNNALLQMVVPFSGPVVPTDPSVGGMAMVAFEVPRDPQLFGRAFTEQWLDFGQVPFAASPAHTWTVAATPPGAGIATVVAPGGAVGPTRGEVLLDFAPVLQILY